MAFGADYIGQQDKKIYVWADDGGERVQIAIAMTCPKTPVEDFGSLDFGNNELNFEDGETIKPMKKTTEISPQEEENLRELMAKLGL